MTDQNPAPRRKMTTMRFMSIVAGSAALALVATLVVGNFMPAQAKQCDAQVVRAAKIDSVATGLLAAVQGTGEGRGYADLAFTDAEGKPVTIADFAGKKLLVNFWASWCIPCREEMPALKEIADTYNSDAFMMLPINLDIGSDGLDKARKFLADEGLESLPLYADSTFDAFKRLQQEAVAVGLPATLLLDEKGCELAVLQGPAEWASERGKAVVEALIGA
ncbi:MAG: TlpA family protein disulfide reductase [Devosia sp.]